MRDHLRNKLLSAKPETLEWRDGDGDPVVLVAPPDSTIREDFRKFNSGDLTDEVFGARLVALMAHAPKTDEEDEPILRDGKMLAGDQLFEQEDVGEIIRQPIGSDIAALRQAAVEWVPKLMKRRDGPDQDELLAVVHRAYEMLIDDEEIEGHLDKAAKAIEKKFADVLTEAGLLGDDEGNG